MLCPTLSTRYVSPLGLLCIEATMAGITKLVPAGEGSNPPPTKKTSSHDPTAAHLRAATAWLDAYFTHQPLPPMPPLAPEGTPFQQAVWRALAEVPYGTTRTYGRIAERVGRPRASQAVGQAVGRNPILLLIPCHRIVAAHSLGGFAYGTALKRSLLEWEGGGDWENNVWLRL